ncbi:aminotransferase class IV [Halalkalibacter urbisdiaboli]|uniref:aminotransferase class IV n=1 Tax=Halalkalibacter urbisdiaboli TaxID=1960589 RepID=UPI003159A43E
MNFVLQHDEIIESSKAVVQINDRGYHFGDGIYEVIRIYKQKPFTLDRHIERLVESACKLDLTIPFSQKKMKELIFALINKNKLVEGIVYIQITRGVSPRNHLYHRGENPILTGFTQPFTLDEKQEGWY